MTQQPTDVPEPARPRPAGASGPSVGSTRLGSAAATAPTGSAPAGSPPPGSARAGGAPSTGPVDGGPATPAPVSPPPVRQPLLVQGAGPAAAAVGLALAAQLGVVPFALALLAVQVVVVLAVLALVDAPASGGAFAVAAAAVVAADAVVLLDDGEVRGLAAVVALSFVAALLHQLTRRSRSRVTESMADTLVVVVLAVSTSCLLALHALDGGVLTVQVVLLAAGASLLLGRVGDRAASRPMLAVGSTRGWPGLLLGLGAGVATAVVVAGDGPPVTGTQAALLGLVCAATVAAADLAVDLGAAELQAGRRDARRISALPPAGLLLPFALLGPIALVAGELVLV